MIDAAIEELTPIVGVRRACTAVGEAQARWYRRHRQSPPPPRPERMPKPQPRALSEVERKEIRRVLNSEEHVDEAPATVYAKLLDDSIYLGSVSTMYRVLRDTAADQRGVLIACQTLHLDRGYVIDAEVTEIAGPKGRHDKGRAAYRHGSEAGRVTLGGRRVPVRRPRVRTVADDNGVEREVHLESYDTFASVDLLADHMVASMLAGQSGRSRCDGLRRSRVSLDWPRSVLVQHRNVPDERAGPFVRLASW